MRWLLVTMMFGTAVGRWSALPRFYEMENDLNQAQMAAQSAKEAAQAAGNMVEAQAQQDAIVELSEYGTRLVEASESAAEWSAKAHSAQEAGNFEYAAHADYEAREADYSALDLQETLALYIKKTNELAKTSYTQRLSGVDFVSAVAEYAPAAAQSAADSVALVRASLRSRIDLALGENKGLAGLLEFATLAFPFGVLAAVYAVLRRGATIDLSLRSEVILFSHLYWAIYYTLLSVLTAAMPNEPPLVAFAIEAPESYAAYQLSVTLFFLTYIGGLAYHAHQERSGTAVAQLWGAVGVFLAVYVTVTYPAFSEELPPTVGWPEFAVYAGVFIGLTGLIRKERKGKTE
jgi:hypothetical protein